MRPRRLILFLCLALALGAYYVFVETPRQQRGEAERARRAALADMEPPQVSRVIISRPDTDIEFTVVGTHWEMVSPLADVANQSAVERLVAAVAGARIERKLPPGNDAADYGLLPPQARVSFLDAAGDTLFRAAIGGNTIDNSFSYATTTGDSLLLIPTAVRRYALAAVEDFRNPIVVTFDLSRIHAYEVVSGRKRVRWQRADGRWFTVSGGDTIRGDTKSVEGLLRRLRGLRARAFLPADAVDFEGAPHVDIFKDDGSAPRRLSVTAVDGGVFSHLEGESRAVEIDSTALVVFTTPLVDLRDRRVLVVDPARVERLTVTTKDTTATIVRAGDGWGSPNPATGTFDSRRVEQFWNHLRALRYADIERVERAPGADVLGSPPTFELAVYAPGDTIIDAVWSCPASDAQTLLTTSRSSQVLGTVEARHVEILVRILRNMRNR